MQMGGSKQRVKLTKDLTKYGDGLIVGAKGWTIPNVKLSIWGGSDTFVAVKFDNGIRLDIAYHSLEIEKKNQ